MANEYINKAELLHRILNDTHGDVFDAIETIETEPTIEIVHCKECKYCTKQDNHPYPPTYWCSQMAFDIDEDGGGLDWFCADGRRTDD